MNKNEEKHLKYFKQYKKNEIFWGLGIENELYLEFEKKINITKDFLFNTDIFDNSFKVFTCVNCGYVIFYSNRIIFNETKKGD